MGITVHKTDLNKILVGERVRGEVFLVEEAAHGKTEGKGTSYYRLHVKNKFGSHKLMVWDPKEVLSEGDFVELFLVGKEHKKYGNQWRVEHYIKSDYPGDEKFLTEESRLNIHGLQGILSGLNFKDYTCKSLYEAFKKELAESLFEEVNLYNSPAHKEYFSARYGLLDYTCQVLQIVKGYEFKKSINVDILKLCAILHHLGSSSCFEPKKDSSKFFIYNESGFLGGPRDQSAEYIQKLRFLAQKESWPVDAIIYKLVERICKAPFDKDPISEEGVALIKAHEAVLEFDRLRKIRDKSENAFTFSSKSLVVDVRALVEEKNKKEEIDLKESLDAKN